MTTLNDTPSSNRIHIGIYGKRNSGKSSLINALAGQNISIVSDVAGTTTDAVTKAMEIHGLGACVLVDTAGYDDEGELGIARIEKTRQAAAKTDIAIILFVDEDISEELNWVEMFNGRKTPVIAVISKSDEMDEEKIIRISSAIKDKMNLEALIVSSKEKTGIDDLYEQLLRAMPENHVSESILGDLVGEGDVVLLVMPQDIQAPKGRLILPQVQTIRELLDKKCIVVSTTTDKIENALKSMTAAPKLIITDSQVFGEVYEHKPDESMLTSFSVLFAAYKGDIDYYTKSAKAISQLNEQSKVLVAECCTHAPLDEDIGRVKIPRMLRNKYGEGIDITVVSGNDFPKELKEYDLVIQCGGCMFNRKYILSRVERACEQGVPMTNYGVAIAYLKGILDKVVY